MRNPIIFGIFTGIAGAAIGFAFGYKCGREEAEEEYKYRQDVASYYGTNGHVDTTNAEIEKDVKYTPNLSGTSRLYSQDAERHIGYDKIITPSEKPPIEDIAKFRSRVNGQDKEDKEPEIDDPNEEEEESPMQDEPRLITRDQYINERKEYDKTVLYFYRDDEIICTGDDEDLPEAEIFLGWDFYKALANNTYAHVRNDELESDFEIHAIYNSFKEDVLDRLETDSERAARREKRRKGTDFSPDI